MTETSSIDPALQPDPWWRRWFISPILRQLTQGISAEKLAWTIAFGCTLGVFPILGTTSIIAFLFALGFHLNQPVIHLISQALWPLHLVLILPFIRFGQWIHNDPPLNKSIAVLLKEFFGSPLQFAQDYWLAAWHGVVAWFLVSLPLLFLIRLLSLPFLKIAARKIARRKESRA